MTEAIDWKAKRAGRWTRSTGKGVVVLCPAHPYCAHSEAVESGGVTASHGPALAAMKRHLETGCEGVQALSRL